MFEDVSPFLVNIAYQDDKQFLPLQAADLLAWQVRRGFSHPEPRRRHLDEARKAQRPHFSFVLDKPLLLKMKAGMDANARRMAELYGLPEDVTTWENYFLNDSLGKAKGRTKRPGNV